MILAPSARALRAGVLFDLVTVRATGDLLRPSLMLMPSLVPLWSVYAWTKER